MYRVRIPENHFIVVEVHLDRLTFSFSLDNLSSHITFPIAFSNRELAENQVEILEVLARESKRTHPHV